MKITCFTFALKYEETFFPTQYNCIYMLSNFYTGSLKSPETLKYLENDQL